MLKWTVAGLVLLNAGLFLWATGHKGMSAGISTARPAVNPAGMRLLRELTPAQSPVPAGPVQSVCFRVGPFLSEPDMLRAGQQLAESQIPFQPRTVAAREIRAHRVYLGPFSTATAIRAQRQLLRASGVSDHYVKHEDGGQDIISLGLFSQKRGAETLLQTLQSKNIKATVRAEDRLLGPTYWIELRLSAAEQRSQTALQQMNWPGERAKLRKYSCI